MNSYHIIFSDEYLDKTGIDKTHPTCNVTPHQPIEYLFGGSLGDKDDQHLNHIITFDPIPKSIGVINFKKLIISVDFELLFNSLLCDKYLFYQHGETGHPILLTEDIIVSNEYDKKPIIKTKVRLGPTPAEWLSQEWGEGNNNNNKIWRTTHLGSTTPISKLPLLWGRDEILNASE